MLSGMEDMLRRKEVGRIFRVDTGRSKKGKEYDDSKGSTLPSLSLPLTATEQPNTERSEFTDWGRWEETGSSAHDFSKMLWWKNEAMACRLVSYLQPKVKPKPPPMERTTVQTAVEQRIPAEKAKRGWGWGKWRSAQNVETCSASSPSPVTGARGGRGTVEGGDVVGVAAVGTAVENEERRAEMNVTAQQLTFRRENDLGIWESMSGWAIVVAVKVRS
jgi:hypothetical protein